LSGTLFTGERLHDGDSLFAVDLARHRAAYEYARTRLPSGRALDLGCGTGYGAASLAGHGSTLVAVDRVRPDSASRSTGAHFLRADIAALPLSADAFDLVVSFQVVEHLADPTDYLRAIAHLVHPDGAAILTTPNVLTSDGVNPYHVHEYGSDELEECLRAHFGRVEMYGVGMSAPVRAYMLARSRRIARIMRLDPLRIRDRLPSGLVKRLFALGALLVRRRTTASEGAPDATTADFPIGAPDESCIDLLAVCREPR